MGVKVILQLSMIFFPILKMRATYFQAYVNKEQELRMTKDANF